MPAVKNEKFKIANLEERLHALELTIENLPLAVGLFSLDGRPLLLNQNFRTLYKVDERWSEDVTFATMITSGALWDWKNDPDVFFKRVVETLKRDGEFKVRNEIGGRIISVHDRLLDGDLILTMQEDITEKVQAEERIAFLASHDPLTLLPNRASLNQTLDRQIDDARSKDRRFATLLVDVDRFKDINDVFGHAAGDTVLAEMARRFADCLGPNDIAARLGGDEFCFLSFGDDQPASAERLGKLLTEAANQPVEWQGQMLKVGLSVGIAVFPADGADRTQLLGSADAALYRAKAEGRGLIRAFEPQMDHLLRDRRVLQNDLSSAVANGELRLRYQPQASIEGEIYGFEALVRWQHPTRGLLSPDIFIPIAEECGLILDIGAWVMKTACREAAGWAKPMKVSVNLSPVQFRHGELAQTVHATLVESGLHPSRLELEITESVLMRDFTRALHVLRQLKALGVGVSLDDFGTGYSSLSYLQSFPFDTLKIDKSFIGRLTQDEQTDEIVRAVISLGRGLKIAVVAEGVETPEQLAFLKRERCTSIQGYLVGKPQPIGDYAGVTGGSGSAAEGSVSSRQLHYR